MTRSGWSTTGSSYPTAQEKAAEGEHANGKAYSGDTEKINLDMERLEFARMSIKVKDLRYRRNGGYSIAKPSRLDLFNGL